MKKFFLIVRNGEYEVHECGIKERVGVFEAGPQAVNAVEALNAWEERKQNDEQFNPNRASSVPEGG